MEHLTDNLTWDQLYYFAELMLWPMAGCALLGAVYAIVR